MLMCLMLTNTVKATLLLYIQGYHYCTSLQRTFESLLSQNYTNFILTGGCICVSIYCNVDMGFKIFDSHARDVYGTW